MHGAPAGNEHELIDTLRAALAAVRAGHSDAFEHATIRVCLDLDVPLQASPAGVVDLSNVEGRIAARLGEIVDEGVSEAFLVQAVRNRLTAVVEAQADTGATDAARAELREIGVQTTPVDPDEAAGAWAVREAWASAAEALIDRRIEAWQTLAAARRAGYR